MSLVAPPEPHLRAVVDIGSNSLHLQLARQRPGEPLDLLDAERAGVRLGAFVDGCIPEPALDAACEALGGMVARARAQGCARFHLAATAALRDARNGPEAARRLGQRVGLPVEVLSGEEEARLTWLGARSRLDLDRALLVDMGGRSTELVLGRGDAVEDLRSLPFGHILAAQGSPDGDPDRLAPWVDAALSGWRHRCAGPPSTEVVLTAGTALTLARVAAMSRDPDPPRHGLRLTLVDLERALDLLRRTPPALREAIPGFDPRRADTLVPGCVMLVALLRRLEARAIVTCQAGLREGLLAGRGGDVAPTRANA